MKAGEELPESDRIEAVRHPRETQVLIGHEEAEAELLAAYRTRRLHHAWLIGGPEGIGKATLAWRLARFLLAYPDPEAEAVATARDLSVPAHHPAVQQVASGAPGAVAVLRRGWNEKSGKFYGDIRVDDVRRAAGLFQQSAGAGRYRIAILDSAEDLNASSANALLKLVEEPPARSLFLIVAHRPARVLPTLRSRCRALLLAPLAPEDVVAAVRTLGAPWSEGDDAALLGAAIRAHGSVGGALTYLSGERLALDRELEHLLAGLPAIAWGDLYRLGDRLGGEDATFETLVASVLAWIHGRIAADAGPRRLAALAEVWDKTRRLARDTLALNLDKKTFLLTTVTELAQALRVQ